MKWVLYELDMGKKHQMEIQKDRERDPTECLQVLCRYWSEGKLPKEFTDCSRLMRVTLAPIGKEHEPVIYMEIDS